MSEKEKKEKKAKKPKKEKAPKTKICPSCQAEIPQKSKMCPRCAAKQKGKAPVVLIAAAAVLLIAAASAVSIFVFHFPIDPPFELPFGPTISDTPLGAAMELTPKQEEAVVAVLGECGIQRITDAKVRSSNASSSVYVLNDAETSLYPDTRDAIIVQMDNAAKTVDSIDFQDNPVYRGGQVIAQATDFYLGTAERDVYLSQTLTAVKARLDIPETAVFPSKSHWSYTTEEKTVTVQSTVTTKNASGEAETRPFTAVFENKKFVSVTLGEPQPAS